MRAGDLEGEADVRIIEVRSRRRGEISPPIDWGWISVIVLSRSKFAACSEVAPDSDSATVVTGGDWRDRVAKRGSRRSMPALPNSELDSNSSTSEESSTCDQASSSTGGREAKADGDGDSAITARLRLRWCTSTSESISCSDMKSESILSSVSGLEE